MPSGYGVRYEINDKNSSARRRIRVLRAIIIIIIIILFSIITIYTLTAESFCQHNCVPDSRRLFCRLNGLAKHCLLFKTVSTSLRDVSTRINLQTTRRAINVFVTLSEVNMSAEHVRQPLETNCFQRAHEIISPVLERADVQFLFIFSLSKRVRTAI